MSAFLMKYVSGQTIHCTQFMRLEIILNGIKSAVSLSQTEGKLCFSCLHNTDLDEAE